MLLWGLWNVYKIAYFALSFLLQLKNWKIISCWSAWTKPNTMIPDIHNLQVVVVKRATNTKRKMAWYVLQSVRSPLFLYRVIIFSLCMSCGTSPSYQYFQNISCKANLYVLIRSCVMQSALAALLVDKWSMALQVPG